MKNNVYITFSMRDGQRHTFMNGVAETMWIQFLENNSWIEGQYVHEGASAVTSKVINAKYIVDVEYTEYK